MSFFSTIESDISNAWKHLTTSPVLQNLESEAEKFFHNLIGVLPWNAVKQKVIDVVTAGLSTVEAHNQLLALAATFVPGGNQALANMVAASAVSVVGRLLSAIPVPTPSTTPPVSTPPLAPATDALVQVPFAAAVQPATPTATPVPAQMILPQSQPSSGGLKQVVQQPFVPPSLV